MIYKNIIAGNFISRPNRFIAKVNINGSIETVHVKNTGRCKELLTDNAKVYCQHFNNKSRKTNYDLISVYKGNRLINMDSQAPNKVIHEFLLKESLFNDIELIKPESKYKNSRFDFYVKTKSKEIYIEVKGVTLENNGVVLFPDAPTQRGIKHINELIDAKNEGYEAYIIFVVQMENVKYFTPNIKTHLQFGEALKRAKENGVKIICYDCKISKNTLEINNQVNVRLY